MTRSKELLPTTRTSDFARVSENDVNVCKQISSLYRIKNMLRRVLKDSDDNYRTTRTVLGLRRKRKWSAVSNEQKIAAYGMIIRLN